MITVKKCCFPSIRNLRRNTRAAERRKRTQRTWAVLSSSAQMIPHALVYNRSGHTRECLTYAVGMTPSAHNRSALGSRFAEASRPQVALALCGVWRRKRNERQQAITTPTRFYPCVSPPPAPTHVPKIILFFKPEISSRCNV